MTEDNPDRMGMHATEPRAFRTKYYPPFDADAVTYPLTTTERNCFQYAAQIYTEADNEVEGKHFPCRSYWTTCCAGYCLGKDVGEWHLRLRMYQGSGWRAIYPADENTRKALNQAVSRSGRGRGRGGRVGTISVVRGERTGTKPLPTERWVYASRPLNVAGALSEWVEMSKEDMLYDLQHAALAAPGVIHAPRPGGLWDVPWRQHGPYLPEWGTDEGRHYLATVYDDEHGEQRMQKIYFHAAYLGMLAGYSLPTRYDGAAPHDCDREEWADLLIRARDEVDGDSWGALDRSRCDQVPCHRSALTNPMGPER